MLFSLDLLKWLRYRWFWPFVVATPCSFTYRYPSFGRPYPSISDSSVAMSSLSAFSGPSSSCSSVITFLNAVEWSAHQFTNNTAGTVFLAEWTWVVKSIKTYSDCWFTGGFAVAIPKLDLFISLVGAFGSSFLGLIFPPILDLVVHWPKVSTATLLKNCLIIIFGSAGFVTGTYASVQEIVIAFNWWLLFVGNGFQCLILYFNHF